MSHILIDLQRKALDAVVQQARSRSEEAATTELRRLGVDRPKAPAYLGEQERELHDALHERACLLSSRSSAHEGLDQLISETAYVQWHRLLFVGFLEANELLIHPEHDIPMTLEDCAEEADPGEAQRSRWDVAAEFAARILPDVFRLDDPEFRVRLAPEDRAVLQGLVRSLDPAVLTAEDALGWAYQYWQTARKKAVNATGNKIEGADLSPVTQLFTENYMVRFLLENSLGAWWAGRHPDSPLLADYDYLRRWDDGAPVAGTFETWPASAAEVTVMDPCCGSGHFLVTAFGMLWRMRAEEEGLSPAAAQDRVLAENLHGLELDPRCTQIAVFNLALEAWKQGGYRQLPTLQLACSGLRAGGRRAEWEALAPAGDDRAVTALGRLHDLFRQADSLGSLIDPRVAVHGDDALLDERGAFGDGTTWSSVAGLLQGVAAAGDVHEHALGERAAGIARAAQLLSGRYTLVVTNPPYLLRTFMAAGLQGHVDNHFALAKNDLATAFIERWLGRDHLTLAVVSPQNWALLGTYARFRKGLLDSRTIHVMARLGSGAFRNVTGEVVKVSLSVMSAHPPRPGAEIAGQVLTDHKGPHAKSAALRDTSLRRVTRESQRSNPDHRLALTTIDASDLLQRRASGQAGIQTGDYPRFGRYFWEFSLPRPGWNYQQSTVRGTTPYGGREHVLLWEAGEGTLHDFVAERLGAWGVGAWIRGTEFEGRKGVAVSQMGQLSVTLYTGELFDNNTAVILPKDEADLPAIWAFCSSPEFHDAVREIDDKLNVTNATLVKVAFDRDRWLAAADAAGPLPQPHSTDPTQWLFDGEIPTSDHPLQVAVARLVGYRWPEQTDTAVDHLRDTDGIVPLHALGGDLGAAERLREVLRAAYGDRWGTALEDELLEDAGGRPGRLTEWLRDTFFAEHVALFHNRPFVWHVWDGRKDGFSAFVDYHRLDRRTLQKLTWTVLEDWIRRQRADSQSECPVPGADLRLAAALELRERLEAISQGEPPYEIYIRWKPLHEQAIGWEPDLDDGVRMNIRPFVRAGVLRRKVGVNWSVDRGRNVDGTSRINELPLTTEEKRTARAAAGQQGSAT